MAVNIEYFLSYIFEKEGNVGNGNCVIARNGAISTSDHVRDVEKFIKDNNHFDKVILSNFIKLREFEGDLTEDE